MLRFMQPFVFLSAMLAVNFVGAGEYEHAAELLMAKYHGPSSIASEFTFPPTARERNQILEQLGDIGPEARVVAADVVQCLQLNEDLRGSLWLALGGMADDAVPHLVEALRDPDSRIRTDALRLLGDLGKDASSAVIGILDDDDRDVKVEALRCLRRIDARAEIVVPILVAKVEDEDIGTASISYLQWLGPRAEAAKKVLMQQLEEPNKRECIFALAAIDAKGTDSVPLLIQYLNSNDPVSVGVFSQPLSYDAAALLADMGDSAAPAVPASSVVAIDFIR